MKFNKKKKTEILEGDLTPMIDMTFQLIAFFMLLINFSEAEVSEKILLPSSELAIPPTEPPDYQIILNLEPNETITFAGQKIAGIQQLGPILEQEVSSAKREDVNAEDVSVVIRSHKDTPTGLVQKLIAKCQGEKLINFALRIKNTK